MEPTKAEIVAEYSRARDALDGWLESATAADLRRRSNETRWTNDELLFHIVFGYMIVCTLLPMVHVALPVGAFETLFFRGVVQTCLTASFGQAPGIAIAAGMYAAYHVGYGMGGEGMVFLFGLGVVYAVAFAMVHNVLVLWPLLTPLGSFFTTATAVTSSCRGRRSWDSPTSWASWSLQSG